VKHLSIEALLTGSERYAAAAKSAVELSVSEIRQIAKEPMEEVAAVILLDQIPRNIYRGKEAKQVSRSTRLRLAFASPWLDLMEM
jgi:uncharacterized protein (DUF924 family)